MCILTDQSQVVLRAKKKIIIPNNMNWQSELCGVKEICKPNPEQAGKSKYDTSMEEAEYLN